MTKSFDQIIKMQLDPIWNQLVHIRISLMHCILVLRGVLYSWVQISIIMLHVIIDRKVLYCWVQISTMCILLIAAYVAMFACCHYFSNLRMLSFSNLAMLKYYRVSILL